MRFTKKIEELKLADTPLVGGKNASLGQMISELAKSGIHVPAGFAITAKAYWYFIEQNNLFNKMKKAMGTLKNKKDLKTLKVVGHEIRTLFYKAHTPEDLKKEIVENYKNLCINYKQKNCDVAVRSSATAEDLPTASFAGQQETFLNVCGEEELIEACKKAMASLFTDRAIIYRIEHGFDHFKIALSVAVQKMIRSDLASSGVVFTLDTETGFKDVIMINSSYGLGESIVKGEIIPDEFLVHKPTLEKGFDSIIKKQPGEKVTKIIYSKTEKSGTKKESVPQKDQNKFSLSDNDILELARISLIIENHYSLLKNSWSPMDIEWAKDGIDGKIYILQARPETVHSLEKNKDIIHTYSIKEKDKLKLSSKILLQGQSIGTKITSGKARVLESVKNIEEIEEGEILVTQMTDPDWVPAMKKSAGIVAERGGRTCHAAIVSRELNIPAIVGVQAATEKIKTGQPITLDCSKGNTGFIYDGIIDFEVNKISTTALQTSLAPCSVMINIADPDSAFSASFLPNDGVGLARIEFIITNTIRIHPMALIHLEKIENLEIKSKIQQLTKMYDDKKQFFIDKLAYGIATIASAFYPKPVIVRFSDFKTNEYRNLIGGFYFEPEEENPMLGFRGASRYYHEKYQEAFALECEAIKKVRNHMGLTNIKIMIPFIRTISEAKNILQEIKRNKLQQDKNNLEIVMMCEVPSNALLIDQFSSLFDGFSIGSNDLTQLTLGIDRDSEILSPSFDERDEAVKKIMTIAIKGALLNRRYIGICGQAPSDLPEVAKFLIECGISSISLNPDSVIKFLMQYT